VSARDPLAIDRRSPPFDQYAGIRWLSPARSGHDAHDHVRHHLFAAQGRKNPVNVLIKVTSKPGVVYEQSLANEIDVLTTINRELPETPYFPFVYEHGRLDDGRLYLIMSLFDELPLATAVGTERVPHRLVAHVMIAIEIARALADLHRLEIVHVDLNPMNVLYRAERGRPVIRIVDFESAFERRRHAAGVFYNPPTTPGYTAPEVSHGPPDARSDVFSLGAVLYTLLAANLWIAEDRLADAIEAEAALDAELRETLLKAVDPDPERRYPSAGALQADLEAYLERIWPGRSR
jgi:serine/threonine protein kinase